MNNWCPQCGTSGARPKSDGTGYERCECGRNPVVNDKRSLEEKFNALAVKATQLEEENERLKFLLANQTDENLRLRKECEALVGPKDMERDI